MAKNMAQIKDGVVISVGWWASKQPETETLVNIDNLSVLIGDEYDRTSRRFLRDGKVIKSDREKQIDDNTIAINDNVSALADLGNASEGNADDANSALAELADMITALDERIAALEAKGE